MVDFIVEPKRSMLIPGFPQAKEAAFTAGAHGMTISGSGPTVFAITNSSNDCDKIESAMKNAFTESDIECETFITTPSIQGVRLV